MKKHSLKRKRFFLQNPLFSFTDLIFLNKLCLFQKFYFEFSQFLIWATTQKYEKIQTEILEQTINLSKK